MPTQHPELTSAEWTIIKTVWANEPCAAPTVQEALVGSHGWTCSTVRTLMERMVNKGLLTSEKVRNLTLYRSAVSRRRAQLGEINYALRHAFDGALKPMLEALISTPRLTPQELDELESLIAAHRHPRSDDTRVQKP